jgi:hypothetical protein
MTIRPYLLVFVAACGSSSAPATATDASSAGDGAGEPSADDAAADSGESDAGPPCNTIANAAPVVSVTQVAADPPGPQGGTIVDGTYWGTSVTIYTGPNGPTGATGTSQMTALVQGSTVQLVTSGQPARRTIALTTADAGFTSVDTCPASQTSQGGYTATPTTLTFFLPGGTDDAGARTVVDTLTKQ